MKKKSLTLALAMVVSASALAGCGNAAEPANSSSIVNNRSAAAGTESYTSSQEDSHSVAESFEDVAVDDKPAQGSIGESGLPYYELGFSPEDFSFYGFNIYSDETPAEMNNAINLLYHDELEKSISEGWSVLFDDPDLWFLKNNNNIIFYKDGADRRLNFQSFEGNTIAGADFVQCPVIPGETPVSEGIEALGLRDLLDAMGIQGTAVEGKYDYFAFESQFSKEMLCRIICSDDNNGFTIALEWTDEDGEDVYFGLSVTNDIISYVGFLKTN